MTDRKITLPEEETDDAPVVRDIDPPVVSSVRPAVWIISAPTPTSFWPPVITIALCAPPVFKRNEPEEPELAVPVENVRDPLVPAAPAFSLLIMIEPEVVAVPAFAIKEIDPPVRLSPLPA